MTRDPDAHRDPPSRTSEPQRSAAGRSGRHLLHHLGHELRTPAHSVIGLAELLLQSPLDERQRRLASMIQQAGQTLLRLVDDILDLSRLESGLLRPQVMPFDLRTVVEEALEMLAAQAEAKELALLQDLPPDLPTALVGDPNRLRQVLVNLLGNGVKFTEQGQVLLRARCAEVRPGWAELELEVSDTGIGIAEADRETVFEPFSRVSAATVGRYGGSGLGLSIVRRLLALMGGEISLDSRPGQGSRFIVRLPLQRQAAPPPTPPREGLTGRAALVVDGNATSRELLCRQLSAWGMVVRPCPEAAAIAGQATGLDGPVLVLLNLRPAESLALARDLESRGGRLEPLPLLPLGWDGGEGHGRWRLTRPLRQAQLYDTLLAAAAAAGERRAARPGTALGRRRWQARILLAEDDPINRELAQIMLRDMGCEVRAVDNGRRLVDALDQGAYDLIFMDCRMPELDGLQAAAAIRAREGRRHTPIVALTATALDGYRERCLAAGMDDFLGKPFTQQQLRTMLARWLPTRAGDRPVAVESGPVPEPASTAPPLDSRRLDAIRALQAPGQPDLLARIIDLWLDAAPGLRRELRQGVSRGGGPAVRDAAHSLASASGNVGALGLVAWCRRLEAAAEQGEDLNSTLAALDREFQRVEAALIAERESLR